MNPHNASYRKVKEKAFYSIGVLYVHRSYNKLAFQTTTDFLASGPNS